MAHGQCILDLIHRYRIERWTTVEPHPPYLSYGMGVDSTAILLRWMVEPSSRTFPLHELTVLTAMTGDEFPETGQLVEDHVLPLLRHHSVRYVQIARRGPLQAQGVEVLADTRFPTRVHLDGAGWKLSDELTSAGTIPQVQSGQRRCTQHFKGWPLDTWLEDEMGLRPFSHAIGFSADEIKRRDRDRGYTGDAVKLDRRPWYPLIDWGWDRAKCIDFIRSVTGQTWPKSCCVYCPFARDKHLDRYRANPAAAVQAMKIELLSLALNPRSTLFSKDSVIKLIVEDDNTAAVDAFYREIAEADWSLYEVRRILYAKNGDPTKKGVSGRSVKVLGTGSAVAMHIALRAETEGRGRTTFVDNNGLMRAVIAERGALYPTVEHELVVALAGARSKERDSFNGSWRRHMARIPA